MTDHIINRDKIVDVIVRELFGPAPNGEEIDTSKPIVFEKKEDSYGPFREKGTGEEIIQRDTPTKRYGVGVLYPFGTQEKEKVNGQDVVGLLNYEEDGIENVEKNSIGEKRNKSTEKIQEVLANTVTDNNLDDLDLSGANTYQPSSLGVSFLAEINEDAVITVMVTGGRYKGLPLIVNGVDRKWWVRSAVSIYAEFIAEDILRSSRQRITPVVYNGSNTENLELPIELYARPYGIDKNLRLITICLINRTKEYDTEAILFQSQFKVTIESSSGVNNFLPYPRPPHEKLDDEEKSIELLYRNSSTFAVGHGCSAGWDKQVIDQRASFVSAECLPVFEVPSTTPNIEDEDGKLINVPMAALAGLIENNDGFEYLEKVIKSYEKWITKKEDQAYDLDEKYKEAAFRHIAACQRSAERMRRGVKFLRSDPIALRAFQLSNHAILLQQIHSRTETRKLIFDEKSKRLRFSEQFIKPNPLTPPKNRGNWRAFQIAFIIMSLTSAANPFSDDRDNVELIWFPTGGGKTEAYFGLAAFAMFYRRLLDPSDNGVQVLMRYTLRLLTTQQFQRASRLICAMEYIRKKNEQELGYAPYSIGMWVGSNNTPNTRAQAVSILKGLLKGDRYVQNKFVIDRCPWCGAQMGPLDEDQAKKKNVPKVLGYTQVSNTVLFRCTDTSCDFKAGLPITVIDEDLYENPPSMIIGTVDKFAMLAWKPEARSLFGLVKDGSRKKSPPGLIIQDELHLISGPLGSMVGLYETVIDELCTDRRGPKPIRPKIISSTATIRNFEEQIRALYGRDKVTLFPPPGLEDSDSFFARYDIDSQGNYSPGRMYVGIHAPSLGSMQTVQVRTFTTLLQAPMNLPENWRDPWWTLLLFFNSLRELGITLSLLQSDIPDYQLVYMNRLPSALRTWRRFSEITELTGRASSEDVPKAITALERSLSSDSNAVDVCLASNILEVGVDIDRLSLMSVIGQPKSTSQYIQVTGRVGRSWWERPGLVVTIYSASKPRDRSHFEKFRSYHQRIYAHVEPTSVTPFSPPALDRALHAIMVAYTMQFAGEETIQRPFPYPSDLIAELKNILLPRVRAIDPLEVDNFEKVFDLRVKEWRKWQPVKWRAGYGDSDIPLLRAAGSYATPEQKEQSWPTMQSMRSVDAECIVEIASPSHIEGESGNAQ